MIHSCMLILKRENSETDELVKRKAITKNE